MEHTTINLGSIDRVPIGQGMCFLINGDEIAVFRGRDGRMFAVHNRCPHRQGPLAEGIIGNGQVVCPLHGHKFDLSTGRGSESHECVKTFPVQEINQEILIEYTSFSKPQEVAV